MNRRDFFGIAASSIFVPKLEGWYRQGSGLLVRSTSVTTVTTLQVTDEDLNKVLRDIYAEFRERVYPMVTPLLSQMPTQRGGVFVSYLPSKNPRIPAKIEYTKV